LLYHLCHYYKHLMYGIGFYAWEDVLFRAIMGAMTAFIVAVWMAPRTIRLLMRMKIGDRPEFHHAALNELMRERANTPTMGGIIILAAIFAGTLFWAKWTNPFIQKALFILVWFGCVGGADDWLKLTSKTRQHSRDGLRPWEKLLFQFGGAMLAAYFLYSDFRDIEDAQRLWLPFYKYGIPLASWIFIILSILYISATSNAVNLTDGMDGLASGCLGIASTTLVILCYIASETMGRTSQVSWASYLLLPQIPQSGELCIFFGAFTGAILGFLWYNCHPAQVFMGDVGSLPLGAALGYGAIVTRNEILLLLIGGVFVMELASVMLQVWYFRHTGGKRIFRCAPIHHHFHLAGWSEPQVVVRFWLLSVAFAVIAMATLKLR
jgi:phospho-N-acetylmuramoyl-pentapeptide-transferase